MVDMIMVGVFLLTCATIGWHLGPQMFKALRGDDSERNRWS